MSGVIAAHRKGVVTLIAPHTHVALHTCLALGFWEQRCVPVSFTRVLSARVCVCSTAFVC